MCVSTGGRAALPPALLSFTNPNPKRINRRHHSWTAATDPCSAPTVVASFLPWPSLCPATFRRRTEGNREGKLMPVYQSSTTILHCLHRCHRHRERTTVAPAVRVERGRCAVCERRYQDPSSPWSYFAAIKEIQPPPSVLWLFMAAHHRGSCKPSCTSSSSRIILLID